MREFSPILCDGCGQLASPQHLARRFQRLEWATRYRPIHLQTLLLGAASPAADAEFLYSSATAHSGEAERLLTAAGTSLADPIAEVLHAEFQRRGVYLSHVLECPLDSNDRKESPLNALLDSRLAAVFTRIRRSWRPKRLVFMSTALGPFVEKFAAAKLECELVLDGNRPFGLDDPDARNSEDSVTRLRDVLAGQVMR